jgi:hypothetical protein
MFIGDCPFTTDTSVGRKKDPTVTVKANAEHNTLVLDLFIIPKLPESSGIYLG